MREHPRHHLGDPSQEAALLSMYSGGDQPASGYSWSNGMGRKALQQSFPTP